MGLPVVQPYRTKGKQTQPVVTALQNVMLVKEENDSLPVNTRKQRTAFPPNYVHSLDSTHMMLTALQCHEAGMRDLSSCCSSVPSSCYAALNHRLTPVLFCDARQASRTRRCTTATGRTPRRWTR